MNNDVQTACTSHSLVRISAKGHFCHCTLVNWYASVNFFNMSTVYSVSLIVVGQDSAEAFSYISTPVLLSEL